MAMFDLIKRKIPPSKFDPIRAFIDVSNRCNLKCIMCDIYSPYAVRDYSRHSLAFMAKDVFRKIIDETNSYIQNYCLQLRGEPLLHPDYLYLLNYCRSKARNSRIFFNTNGLLLDKEKVKRILEIGVNEIYCSIDAFSEETYNKIRLGSNFSKVMDNVEYLISERHNSATKLDVGVSFVLQEANIHEQEAFLGRWKDKADYVLFYAKAELDRTRKNLFFKPHGKRIACAAVNENIVILSDGTIVPCCGDLGGEICYGNMKERTIVEILSSGNVCKFRTKVHNNDVAEIPLCRDCIMWAAGESRLETCGGIPVTISPIHKTYQCSNIVQANNTQ